MITDFSPTANAVLFPPPGKSSECIYHDLCSVLKLKHAIMPSTGSDLFARLRWENEKSFGRTYTVDADLHENVFRAEQTAANI